MLPSPRALLRGGFRAILYVHDEDTLLLLLQRSWTIMQTRLGALRRFDPARTFFARGIHFSTAVLVVMKALATSSMCCR
jgi:hypothetical protein